MINGNSTTECNGFLNDGFFNPTLGRAPRDLPLWSEADLHVDHVTGLEANTPQVWCGSKD